MPIIIDLIPTDEEEGQESAPLGDVSKVIRLNRSRPKRQLSKIPNSDSPPTQSPENHVLSSSQVQDSGQIEVDSMEKRPRRKGKKNREEGEEEKPKKRMTLSQEGEEKRRARFHRANEKQKEKRREKIEEKKRLMKEHDERAKQECLRQMELDQKAKRQHNAKQQAAMSDAFTKYYKTFQIQPYQQDQQPRNYQESQRNLQYLRPLQPVECFGQLQNKQSLPPPLVIDLSLDDSNLPPLETSPPTDN